jgi:selenide,water dikinase
VLNARSSIARDVVLIGAGHAHVQVLKHFGAHPPPGVRLTLITPGAHTPYSGMLPGLIAGHYSFDDAHIDTRPLCRFASARLHLSAATGIDRATKMVICDNRPPVPYDVLSINIGSTPNTEGVPGAAAHAIPVKPIDGFLARFEALKARVLKAGGASRIAVIGGGAAGVELTLALQYRLRSELQAAGHDPAGLRFNLLTASDGLLQGFPPGFIERFETILAQRGIELSVQTRVVGVEPGALHLQGAEPQAADEVLWVTQAQPAAWLARSGLPVDEHGFLRVDETLRAKGADEIFGVGDLIAFGPRAIPKSGVYAVRAGSVLAENIGRLLSGRSLKAFEPQREALYLVSTGDPYAVGTRNGFVFAGRWVWRWKDWIDRRFMARFKELPERTTPEATAPGGD